MVKIQSRQIKDTVTLADLLKPESFEALYRITGKRYSRAEVKSTVRVERAEREPGFWDRLMRAKPGFDKGDR